ncbi:MAG: alpha/beta hydrolase [Candidatus Dormiibacterota bacterium]
MSRRFLIVHGLANHRPPDHWQWWLTDQLRQLGEQVRYPQFPDPEAPSLEPWLELLSAEFAMLGAGERVAVCHSLGCALWYQAAARGVLDLPADRVLLVAPPGPGILALPVTAEFHSGPWNAQALASSSRTPIRLVASDLDTYCTEGPASAVYGHPLDLDAETIAGAGHLSVPDGYGPWPQALRWCLDGTVRFSAPHQVPAAS